MARTNRQAATALEDPAPRWRRRAADRPREILDAALTVFVAKGFASTKLDDVATAAGISKGLLYRYFDNKAELFKEVIRQTLVTTIRDVGDRARASDSARVALDIFLDQMVAIANDPRRSAIPKLVISESGNFPELAVFYLAEVIGPALTQLTALVRRGIDGGEFRQVDPDLTAKCIVAPLILSVIWRHTFARHAPSPFAPDALIRQHRDILLRGLATPARRKRRSS
ncbi:TetR/AcrR family transcriptional regulator [Dongia deserti]|uniref:TetR/AcrR family transcriptional regulator n=1 Tax=Dongia deserti TaxID=2268030 RepID=UPI000E653A8D|nr:TetR/AcrR family transcriptional regulator [Dongia deserti]